MKNFVIGLVLEATIISSLSASMVSMFNGFQTFLENQFKTLSDGEFVVELEKVNTEDVEKDVEDIMKGLENEEQWKAMV